MGCSASQPAPDNIHEALAEKERQPLKLPTGAVAAPDADVAAEQDAKEEAARQMPLLGVSIEVLRKAAAEVPSGCSTAEVCVKFVKAATQEKACSYADLLTAREDEESRSLVGRATHFVSHAWRYKYEALVAALESFVASRPEGTPAPLFWVDIFVVNQHVADLVSQSWWAEAFQNAVKTIGSTVLIMRPWDSPIAVSRAWCLWEIYVSLAVGAKLNVCLPPSEGAALRTAMMKDPYAIIDVFDELDARKAEAFHESDRQMIFRAIERSVGFDAMNTSIKAGLTQWLESVALELVERVQSGELDIRAVCNAPTKAKGSGSTIFRAASHGYVNLVRLFMLHPEAEQVVNGTSDSWPPFPLALTENRPQLAQYIMDHPAFDYSRVDWQLASFVIPTSKTYHRHPDAVKGTPYAETEAVLRRYFERRVAKGHPHPDSLEEMVALVSEKNVESNTGQRKKAEEWGVLVY